MSARQLLDELRERGLVFEAEGLSLVVDAPEGAMSDDTLTTIEDNKREILWAYPR